MDKRGRKSILFLGTDNFWRDYNDMVSKEIKFVREPKIASYGTVAVFEDLYSNLWDLVEFKEDHPFANRLV